MYKLREGEDWYPKFFIGLKTFRTFWLAGTNYQCRNFPTNNFDIHKRVIMYIVIEGADLFIYNYLIPLEETFDSHEMFFFHLNYLLSRKVCNFNYVFVLLWLKRIFTRAENCNPTKIVYGNFNFHKIEGKSLFGVIRKIFNQ